MAIAAVHVAAWRSAYPGILPDSYLARMSVTRQAISYERAIARGVTVIVAANDVPPAAGPASLPRIVGFATGAPNAHTLGDGEIETLYVLDDWRDQGVGRGLVAAVGQGLAQAGCLSAYCWVLRENPSRWFYQHIGGRAAAAATVRVAGLEIPQSAFVWNPISLLWSAAPAQPPD